MFVVVTAHGDKNHMCEHLDDALRLGNFEPSPWGEDCITLMNPAAYMPEALKTAWKRINASYAEDSWTGARFESLEEKPKGTSWREARTKRAAYNTDAYTYCNIGSKWLKVYYRPL